MVFSKTYKLWALQSNKKLWSVSHILNVQFGYVKIRGKIVRIRATITYNSRSAADFSKISFLCWLKSSFSFSAESFSSFDHSTVRPSRYSSIWAAHSGYFFFNSLKINFWNPSGWPRPCGHPQNRPSGLTKIEIRLVSYVHAVFPDDSSVPCTARGTRPFLFKWEVQKTIFVLN